MPTTSPGYSTTVRVDAPVGHATTSTLAGVIAAAAGALTALDVVVCLDTQDTDTLVEIVRAMAPVYGGINLEDIAAPRCFEIEARLKAVLDGRAVDITQEMLIAAATATAIADTVGPDELNPTYIVPSVFDPAVAPAVAAAVRDVAAG